MTVSECLKSKVRSSTLEADFSFVQKIFTCEFIFNKGAFSGAVN